MNDVSPLALPATEGAAPASHSHPPRALQRLLQRRLQQLLDRLACGSLRVRLPGQTDAVTLQAQGTLPGPSAELVLHRWRALWRLASGGDIGLAEAYRDDDWSTPDLTALLELGARNEAAWQGASAAAGPWRWAQRALHRLRDNTRRGSRRNIASHYDLGNDFYRAWLDEDMVYSSGIYRTPGDTLAQAQAAKLSRVAELLQLPEAPEAGSDCRVLEIGCGWGALACALAQRGATVRGLTLSTEQLAHARERAQREGLQDRVNLHLQDYRDETGRHDRIVSIEMIEAVGEAWWPTYFATLRDRLQPGGVAVIQAITIADEAFESYRRGADFIQHLVFPGGMLPSPGVLQREAARAGLVIEHAETFGSSYARTLVDWRHRFEAAWPRIAPLGFDERFRRLWRYYLCYCEAGFNTGRVDVGLYRLRHAGGMNAAQA